MLILYRLVILAGMLIYTIEAYRVFRGFPHDTLTCGVALLLTASLGLDFWAAPPAWMIRKQKEPTNEN